MASPVNMQAILAALAKLGNNVPAGVTSEFLAQNHDLPAVVAILVVGCLVTVVVALRWYARQFVVKAIGLDDWLTVITMVPYYAFIVLCIVLIHLGSGRHYYYIQYVLDDDTVDMTEVLDFAAHIIYTTTLVICRLSGIAFYRRISNGHPSLMIATSAGAVFIVLAYLPQVFLIIFHCLPVTGVWPYSWQVPEVNRYSCLQWGTVYVTNSVISLVCDMILFIIPIGIIRSIKASLSKKLKLALILLPGTLVIGISSVRIYLVVVGQWDADESWSYDPLLAIEVAEIGGTLISLSVPSLKPLVVRFSAFLDSSVRSAVSGGTRRSRPRTAGTATHRTDPYRYQYQYPSARSNSALRSDAEQGLEMSNRRESESSMLGLAAPAPYR